MNKLLMVMTTVLSVQPDMLVQTLVYLYLYLYSATFSLIMLIFEFLNELALVFHINSCYDHDLSS